MQATTVLSEKEKKQNFQFETEICYVRSKLQERAGS